MHLAKVDFNEFTAEKNTQSRTPQTVALPWWVLLSGPMLPFWVNYYRR